MEDHTAGGAGDPAAVPDVPRADTLAGDLVTDRERLGPDLQASLSAGAS